MFGRVPRGSARVLWRFHDRGGRPEEPANRDRDKPGAAQGAREKGRNGF